MYYVDWKRRVFGVSIELLIVSAVVLRLVDDFNIMC